MKVGVLAVQGAFDAHARMLAEVGAAVTLLRTPAGLDCVDAVVLPGGESTTMTKMLRSSGLFEPLRDAITAGMPAFGTCAGLILLAARLEPVDGDVCPFGVIDMTVSRNAYGRQIDSFERDVALADAGSETAPFHAVFIRAPVVTSAGPSVEVLATLDERPVLVAQGAVMAATFHPELTADTRLHERFVRLAGTGHSRTF